MFIQQSQMSEKELEIYLLKSVKLIVMFSDFWCFPIMRLPSLYTHSFVSEYQTLTLRCSLLHLSHLSLTPTHTCTDFFLICHYIVSGMDFCVHVQYIIKKKNTISRSIYYSIFIYEICRTVCLKCWSLAFIYQWWFHLSLLLLVNGGTKNSLDFYLDNISGWEYQRLGGPLFWLGLENNYLATTHKTLATA